MNTLDLALAAVVGAMLGSFANVVIYRLPAGASIVRPGSRCPHCGHPVRPWDNVPLISYLLLRGRCRDCRAPIAIRYPLVEGLMALLGVGVRLRFAGPIAVVWVPLLSALLFAFLLVVITFIDLDHQLIPNRITYPGIAVGMVLAAIQGRALLAGMTALGAGGLILAIVIASRGGMGGGDVKLAGLIGVFLPWPGAAVSLFLGFVGGGLVSIVLLALRLRGRKDAIPFGPALAAGALAALFWGNAIWAWYWPR